MKAVVNSSPPVVCLLFVSLLPAGAPGAEVRSSMEISVQVVRPDYSAAAVAFIEAAGVRGAARSAGNGYAACKAIGKMIILEGAWASCNWDPDGRVYRVTVQY